MAITFNGVVLGDSAGDGFDGTFDSRVESEGAVQMEDLIRSTAPSLASRGNRRYTVTFSARKRHASHAAAKAYCGTHAKALAGEGTFSGYGLSLTKAVCSRVSVSPSGIVTTASYSITGTEAVSSLP